MEELYFDKECREKLLAGINKANKAVSATMGPMGKTVIIPDSSKYNQYRVTKDGASVINSIKLKDPVENTGVQLLRDAANLTVNQAGDGTTTSTVLATAFINNLKDFNTVEINKAFDDIIPKVIKQLKDNSRELKREDIKHVATISANNDSEIGDIIQQAFNHSDLVKVEESNNNEDSLVTVDGIQFETSYFSKNFADKKGICEFKNPYVLIIDGKLEKADGYEKQIQMAQNHETPLVIFTEHIHEQLLKRLESLVLSGNLHLVVIKTPGFGPFRKDLIQDITKFTTPSGRYVGLGKLKSIRVTPTKTIMVKDDSVDITEHIESLKSYLESDIQEHQKDLINKRIENLTSNLSIIKVGGRSEVEMKERKDRYDDAVLAVACALEEGIVEGAGYALKYAGMINFDFKSKINTAITDSLSYPMDQISKNGCYLEEMYYNGSDDTPRKTYFDKNIIDPLKVTRCALENAVSVAKIVLSTEAVVLNEIEWNRN